jgi:L-asparaginase II
MSEAYRGGVPLAEVVRSGFVEGRHHGSVVVLGADGSVLASAGDPVAPIFPRSSNKPMQAVAMLRAGLELEPASLSLAAGSHSGEPMHVRRVRAMLAAGGLSEADLRCPVDYPLSDLARTDLLRAGVGPARVFMNCSGKHAAMLLTCAAAGWPVNDYRASEHPLQRACRAVVEELTGESVAAIGVDGCGAAVMAVSLTGLARAFLTVASASSGPERAVADAMRAYPELMSGTGREDARLMHGIPGLLCKVGAEGVHAGAVPGLGAVAVKIDDGAGRARDAAMVAALRRLGVEAAVLDELAEPVVLGGGQPVGRVRAVKVF